MKIRSRLFLKSFLLSLVVFVLLAGIIITSLYMDKTALLPTQRETTTLVGITDGDSLISLMLINAVPETSELTLLPIPDNTIVMGKILQDQYSHGEPDTVLKYVSGMIGRSIDRYLIISSDALEDAVNTAGTFTYFIQYQFTHSGKAYGGRYTQMNGELVRSMLTYNGYDKKTVSTSELCADFFKSFMSTYANAARLEQICDILTDSISKGSTDTDFSDAELSEYLELLSKYSSFTCNELTLGGKLDTSSSERNYFIPETLDSSVDVFK